MATFVLVHGSWAGGVVWRQLAPRLRKAGHEVYAPTLTGTGERKHLLNRDINLDTHIQDVIGVVEEEDLSDIVLVGNSYGGMVTSGVADRVPEKVCLARLSRRLRAGGRTIALADGFDDPAPCCSLRQRRLQRRTTGDVGGDAVFAAEFLLVRDRQQGIPVDRRVVMRCICRAGRGRWKPSASWSTRHCPVHCITALTTGNFVP
jgi:pimeloyl-ACP methyl ester carboxylesterase